MTTKARLRQTFTPGRRFTATNHYIDRKDHPCYGTREVTVDRVNSNSVWLCSDGRLGADVVEWPKATQVEWLDDDAVRLYGGGAGQQPDDLFMTFVPS